MACGVNIPIHGDIYGESYTGWGWIPYRLSIIAAIAVAIMVLIFIGLAVFVLCVAIHRMAWLDDWKVDYIKHENQNGYGDRCENHDRRTETQNR